MIAEIIPEAYDAVGRKVFRPDSRRHGIHPTFPMGRYVHEPLKVRCQNIQDIRKFLAGCRGVSDEEQFGKNDYWQPPEQFEQTKKGDCEDFALWTWRQLMGLGYSARVVFGRHGRYGIGHAWVGLEKDGKQYLVEPQLSMIGETFPRLSTLRYHPKFSVAWDNEKISFYSHEDRNPPSSLPKLLPLVPEWIVGWGWLWLTRLTMLPYTLWLKLRPFAKLRTKSP